MIENRINCKKHFYFNYKSQFAAKHYNQIIIMKVQRLIVVLKINTN